MLQEKIGQLCVGSGEHFAELDLKLNKDAKQYNGRIVECTFDKRTRKRMFLRVIDDKSFPNSYDTVKSNYYITVLHQWEITFDAKVIIMKKIIFA